MVYRVSRDEAVQTFAHGHRSRRLSLSAGHHQQTDYYHVPQCGGVALSWGIHKQHFFGGVLGYACKDNDCYRNTNLFSPFFFFPPAIFIISLLMMARIMVARPVASPEQIVKTLRAIAPIRISIIAMNTDGSDKTELTSFVVFHIN